jgi:nucleotide-binding universal stress UspA family protein
MIRTIVTPIDGSVHAQLALDMSADLAAKYDAQLVLLNIGVRDDNVPEKLYNAASRELKEAESNGQETGIPPHQSQHLRVLAYLGHMLMDNARQQAESKGVKRVETVIDLGDAGERILHHAKQKSADLIVMGSRGFGELKGLALGSVSHKVFHLAPCSCVTVHQKDGQPDLEEIKSILVPTDGSEQADRAVALASDIAAKTKAKISLMYAMWRGPSLEKLRASIDMDQLSDSTRAELDPALHPIAEHMSSAFIPPVVSKDALKEIGEQVLARGRQTAEAKGVEVANLVVIDGDPARKIVQTAKHEKADLIAMGSRGLGGAEGLLTGSVSYKVNHTAPCSCMVVR